MSEFSKSVINHIAQSTGHLMKDTTLYRGHDAAIGCPRLPDGHR